MEHQEPETGLQTFEEDLTSKEKGKLDVHYSGIHILVVEQKFEKKNIYIRNQGS